MNLIEVEKIVAGIQTRLFKNSNSYSVGMLKSHFKGTGLIFKEHRIYNHGDDVRFIDWKMLAKSNIPYVKTFEEERNVEIIVIIDASLSMFIGYNEVSKLQAALEISALLYLLARESGDKVRTIFIADEVMALPYKAGKEGIITLVKAMEHLKLIKQDGKIDREYYPKKILTQKEKLSAVLSYTKKNKEVVVLSDFKNFLTPEGLKAIFYQKNVHCFRLQSPLDGESSSPYSVWGFDACEFGKKTKTFRENSIKVESDFPKNYAKKLKTLDLRERYLEQFIRSML